MFAEIHDDCNWGSIALSVACHLQYRYIDEDLLNALLVIEEANIRGKMTVNDVFTATRDMDTTLNVLASIADHIIDVLSTCFVFKYSIVQHRLIGGDIISYLYERYQRNVDAKLNSLFVELIETMSEQFFRLLDSWIYFGNLNDDYALEVNAY